MYQWHTGAQSLIRYFLVVLMAWHPVPSIAQPISCVSDFNGNGAIDQGELQTCISSAAGYLCPLDAQACTVDLSGNDVCPLGAGYTCLDNGTGTRQCSAITCFDEATNTVASPATPTVSYQDDGERDASGNCLAAPMIFSGRTETCRPAGTSNAWKDCCENESGDIYQDSSGASVEGFITNKALTVSAQAAYAAVSAYSSALAAGQTAAQASEAASTAATQELMVAFDPTSLVVAIIIYVIMSYLMKACPADDMITAMKVDSDYCHYIGSHCVSELLGSCSQDERVYCCFNSKLARILHEQGRPQVPEMGGWGTWEEPNCRGFTPEEFQALDFSRIDFTEYYADLRMKAQSVIQSDLGAGVDDFQNRGN